MSWQSVTLGTISDAIDYGVTASAIDEDTGTKFLRITDIQDNSVDWSTVPFCVSDARKLAASALKSGDIVFARTGATTGKSFRILDCPNNAVFASYLIRVRPSDTIDSGFLSHFFQTSDYWNQIQSFARGATQPGVNSSVLRELRVPLPPLDEQRRIAAILDQADALRRKRREAMNLLDGIPLSFFDRQFGDPTANPRGIRSAYLGEVSEFGSGGTPTKSKAEYWTGDFPWVSPKDMKKLRISRAEDTISEAVFAETNLKKIPAGTPLIVVRGMILVHTVPIAMAVSDLAINQDMKSIHFDDRVLPEFGLWCLKAQHRSILTKVDTAAHGTKRLDSEVLKQLPILLPPLSEQQSFVAAIEDWEALRHRLENQAEALETIFASLQHRAFRGEL